MEAMLGVILAIAIAIIIMVAISRWIFRINDIIKRLDTIADLLKSKQTTS